MSAVSRILLLCWRDSTHPQGGGSERYLEHVAAGLASAGHTVVYRTSRAGRAPRSEVTDAGVRVSRGGGRFTVYPRALGAILAGRFGLGPLGAGCGRRRRQQPVRGSQPIELSPGDPIRVIVRIVGSTEPTS